MKLTDWTEFDGIRSTRMSEVMGATFVLVYGRTGGDTVDLEVAFAGTMGMDGWHHGRNEQYTHWAAIILPEP